MSSHLADVQAPARAAREVSPAASACFGRASEVADSVVTGWFVSPGLRAGSGQVAAFIDGDYSGRADVQTFAALPAEAPATARAFSYQIPWHCQDGRSHVLSLVLDDGTAVDFPASGGGTRANLRFRFEEPLPRRAELPTPGRSGTPTPREPDAQAAYTGLADPFTGTTITGWAVSRLNPSEPARLRMFVDGEAAGDVVCDQPHAGLQTLGLADDAGGFAFSIPDRFCNGLSHCLTILFDDGTPLQAIDSDGITHSALHFTAEPVTSIAGIVDGLHGDRIRGWVMRKHHKTGACDGHVTVQVLCNGIAVGDIVADLPRMDVARENRCDPFVGFEFKLPHYCLNGQEFEFVFRALPEGEELAGCPLPVRHAQAESADELRLLADTVGDLCAQVFKIQRQVLGMLPTAEATVHNYDGWARRQLTRMRSLLKTQPPLAEDAPLVSVIMPTFRTRLAHLDAAIESVRAQTYQNWELIIVDDGSRDRALKACLLHHAASDSRIKCLFRANGGISRATNAGLRKARGTYVMLFDHDDLLVDVAIELLMREALRTGAKLIYGDEDKIDTFGAFSEPNLKPDWNYRLLLAINYVCHAMVIETATLRRAGLLRPEFDGAQDHDLLLRLSEICAPGEIAHVPEVLYHWRKSLSSTASSGDAKPYAVEAGRRAVAEHVRRRGFTASEVTAVENSTTYSLAWGLAEEPSVTIIVPFKDQVATTRRCVECLLAHTRWTNWKVVLVDNGSVRPETEEFCRELAETPHVVVRRVDEAFNFSRLNNIAARENPAEFFVFLNNDVFMEQENWLRVLVDEALASPDTAIVGAKLLYPNRTVQHAGVVLGVGGVADHVFRGIPADHPGYLSRARCAQHYSAVTAACMLCRGPVFLDVGGFDEQELMVAFNDVDLCLKVGSRGWRVVWTPDLMAEHHESLSRGDDLAPGKAQRFFYENHVMMERWGRIISADPFYHPQFSPRGGIFSDLR
ncbi:MAG: glycosyltransferase family 2 protein [Acidisphaera sp.]|nr:glycosyltransferase family 2 protein [Acidisphaera sp.]